MAYNLTIHELDALFAWWRMLSSEERCVKENIEKLVTGTEKTILGDRSWNDVISGDITYLTSPPSTGVN